MSEACRRSAARPTMVVAGLQSRQEFEETDTMLRSAGIRFKTRVRESFGGIFVTDVLVPRACLDDATRLIRARFPEIVVSR